MTVSRVTDRDPENPWQGLRLARGQSADPRVIIVRALCRCGWVQWGDPPEILGQASEHFRSHWNVRQELPSMSIEEDSSAEADVRSLQIASDQEGAKEE